MKLRKLLTGLLILTSLIWGQMATAQVTPEDCPDCAQKKEDEKKKEKEKRDTVTLQEVLVTAFHAGAVSITPTKTVIDVNKFDKAGTVDRVEDVLQHIAGVDIMRNSAADPQQYITMRGFDDSRFTVAIDGRPITAPTAGADTFVDWSSLTTGDIEKIEIIRGASSARYENSQGGIINLITKKGKSDEGSLKPKVNLQSSYASFNTYTQRLTVGGSLNKVIPNFGYFFNVGYKSSDGYLRNNSWWGRDYSGRINYELPTKGKLSLSYKESYIHMGYPVVNDSKSLLTSKYDSSYVTVREDSDTLRRGRLISYPGGESWKDKNASHLDFHFDQPIGNTKLMLTLFQTQGHEDSWSYQKSGSNLVQTYQGSAVTRTTDMSSLSDGRKENTWGGMIDYRLDLWDNNTLTVGYSQRRMETGTMDDVWRIQGVYFEDVLALTQKLSLNTGLRYVQVRENTYAYKDPPFGAAQIAYRHLITTDLFLPKFTATYRFTPSTETFVSVNRDYHLPGC